MAYKLSIFLFLVIFFFPNYIKHNHQLNDENNILDINLNVPIISYFSVNQNDTIRDEGWYKKVTSDIEASQYQIYEDTYHLAYHSVNVKYKDQLICE